MGLNTGSVDKKNGRNASLGGPMQWDVKVPQTPDSTSILGATTLAIEDSPKTYTSDGDFDGQPPCPQAARVAWTGTTGTVNAVVFTCFGQNFWMDPTDVEIIRLTAEGTDDTKTSYRHFAAVKVKVEGEPGSTVEVSVGYGDGIGTPNPFYDNSDTISDPTSATRNKDILAVRDATGALLDVDTVYPDPYNTIVLAAGNASCTIEMQTRYGDTHRIS